MIFGIDLGTTFCCVSVVDEYGHPVVVPNDSQKDTTPSVIWFNGKQALVGDKANEKKFSEPHHIYEFVKRNIGKPIESSDPEEEVAPYEIGGFKYGSAGMSAIILRKLKRDIMRYLKSKDVISKDATEESLLNKIQAVITVPAYFGEKERQETRMAGYAAGLDVVGIINEPTAAAIAFGIKRLRKDEKIMVFDLGGGTLDITILRVVSENELEVITSSGAHTLGGKDWDKLIIEHIAGEFYDKFNIEIPRFELQKKAIEIKFALSNQDEYQTTVTYGDHSLEMKFYRRLSPNFTIDSDTNEFSFEDRASDYLQLCRAIYATALERANLTSQDIDEIVLAGGSCRMPMIPKLLEELVGRPITKDRPGYSYDTAISFGAALYGYYKFGNARDLVKIQDVLSHGFGIKVRRGTTELVDYILRKDDPLPARKSVEYPAQRRATLYVYEGESENPLECRERGKLQLDNNSERVKVTMSVDENGYLKVFAEHDGVTKEVPVQNKEFDFSEKRKRDLREKILSIQMLDPI